MVIINGFQLVLVCWSFRNKDEKNCLFSKKNIYFPILDDKYTHSSKGGYGSDYKGGNHHQESYHNGYKKGNKYKGSKYHKYHDYGYGKESQTMLKCKCDCDDHHEDHYHEPSCHCYCKEPSYHR